MKKRNKTDTTGCFIECQDSISTKQHFSHGENTKFKDFSQFYQSQWAENFPRGENLRKNIKKRNKKSTTGCFIT